MSTAVARGRRSLWAAGVAAAVAFVALGLPATAAWLAPDPDGPVFPSEVASYSWFTPHTAVAPIPRALMLYQNGVGVEFGDTPQAVVLGADGSAYRRFGAAEALSTPEQQGDPAYSVLSADGTFVVVGGGDGQGFVDVVTIADDSRRRVPIGSPRSVVPVSIAADADTVVVLLSPREFSPADREWQLYTDLAVLSLETGVLREFPDATNVTAAAITPDGARIVADRRAGFLIVDVATGRVTKLDIARPVAEDLQIAGEAFSPDGTRFAGTAGDALRIIDTTSGASVEHTIARPGADTRSGTAIGWRDDETVLVYATGSTDAGEFAWVDAATGAQTPFSTYETGFTGAALRAIHPARDLVATWQVQDRPIDRAWVALVMPVLGALAVGGLAAALLRRWMP